MSTMKVGLYLLLIIRCEKIIVPNVRWSFVAYVSESGTWSKHTDNT